MRIGRPEEAAMDIHANQVQPYQYPTGLIGRSFEGLEVEPSDWDITATELREKLMSDAVAPLKQMDFDPAKPATYYFKTQAGAEGVLQIMGLVEDPKGIRIRYKVVQFGAAAPMPLEPKRN